MEPPQGIPHRVYIHVGAPKTGTTFIQQMLFHHRADLAEFGVLYPADHYDEHFLAAVDLQDLAFNRERRPEASGHWEKIAFRARGWPGISIISHDVFAGASAEQAKRAIASLEPAEVHVVFTARDLARQLPSHWQEDVKHGETAGFNEWFDACWQHDSSTWNRPWFWAVEDVPDVLGRWAAMLPSAHVHLVTVPPADQPQRILWERFASVVGLGGADLDLNVVDYANSGLGRVEVALMRRLNAQRDSRMTQTEYEHVVKGAFAHDILTQRANKQRLVLPADRLDLVQALAREWIEKLAKAEYDVVGSLDELIPRAEDTAAANDIDTIGAAELQTVSIDSIHELLVRIRDERMVADDLARRRDELESKVEELSWRVSVAEWAVEEHRNLPDWERVKRTVVEIGRTNRTVGKVLGFYRRSRRRDPPLNLPPGRDSPDA